MQTLVDENPTVTGFRNLLAIGHRNLGILLLHMGKSAEANDECRTALAMVQKLADENPTVSRFRDDLAFSLNHLGDVVRSLGRVAEAIDLYERGITVKERQIRQDSTSMEDRYMLVCLTRRRGLAFRDLGEPARAVTDTRRALGLCDLLQPRSSWDLFETACCHAALAGLAEPPGSGVSSDEGKAEATTAIKWLLRAVAMGYRNTNELRIESALDPLRNRPDFKKLMAELEKKSPAEQAKK